jgi:hypothetical protein
MGDCQPEPTRGQQDALDFLARHFASVRCDRGGPVGAPSIVATLIDGYDREVGTVQILTAGTIVGSPTVPAEVIEAALAEGRQTSTIVRPPERTSGQGGR